jgi:hypothetical protein
MHASDDNDEHKLARMKSQGNVVSRQTKPFQTVQ